MKVLHRLYPVMTALTLATAHAAGSYGPPAPAAAVVPTATVAPTAATATVDRPDASVLGAATNAWSTPRPRIDRPVGADEAVALALRFSPVIAAMQQDVEMARQMLAMARARTYPMLSVNAWGTYGDAPMIVNSAAGVEPAVSRTVPAGGSLDANFMAMYPLFTGGRLGSQVSAEQSRVQASGQDLTTMRLDMALQVLTMVRQLTTMRGMIDVATEAVATNQERVRIDRAAYEVGRIPMANVLRNEAELASARQQLANQVRDYRVMLADLKAMMGVHPLSTLEVAPAPAEPVSPAPQPAAIPAAPATGTAETPPTSPPLPPAAPAPPPADLTSPDPELLPDLTAAARQRPELAAARARLAAAGYDVSAANAAFLPQVSLFAMGDAFASRMNAMNRWEEFTVGVGVSLPLLDGGMRSAQVRRARAERARLSAQEQEAALKVAREVSQARDRLAAARTNVETARAALVAAREDYRLMQLRYQAGLAVNVEVLDALRMRTMAAVNHLTARQELAIAEDQRRRAVGDPTLIQPAPTPAAAPEAGATTDRR